MNGAVQNGIQLAVETDDRLVLGGDLSFHVGGLFQSDCSPDRFGIGAH